MDTAKIFKQVYAVPYIQTNTLIHRPSIRRTICLRIQSPTDDALRRDVDHLRVSTWYH
jgi:hypothetical protein